jgi:tetratricopeptide (TPR) repeat protein
MRGKAPSNKNGSSQDYVHVEVGENWLETHISPGDAFFRFANDSRGIAQLINLCRQRGVDKIYMKAAGEHGARARQALTLAGLSVTAASPLRALMFADAGRSTNARRMAAISLVGVTIALGVAGLSAWQWGRAEQTLESASETTKGWTSDATQKLESAPGAIASFLAGATGSLVGSNHDDKADQPDATASRARPDEAKSGELRFSAGDRAAVLQSHGDSLAIINALLAAGPGDGGRRRDLSVAHEKLGQAQRAQADSAAELQSFRDGIAASKALSDANPGDSFEIFKALSAADPGDAGRRRDLSVIHEKLGEVQLAGGDHPAALQSFRDGVAFSKALSDADPGDAGRRRDLAVAQQKLGQAQLAQRDLEAAARSFSESFALIKALSDAGPADAGRRRDLATAYEKLGDVQLAQRDPAAAARSYSDSLALIKALSAASPGDIGPRRDLALAHEKLGDAQLAQGDMPAATRSYRDSFETLKALSAADPGDAGRRRDIIAIYLKLSIAEPPYARDYLLKAQAVLKELADSGRSTSSDRAFAAEIERRLKGVGAAAIGAAGEQKRCRRAPGASFFVRRASGQNPALGARDRERRERSPLDRF